MRIPATAPLFPWEYLDTDPDLVTLRKILDELPDRDLLHALREYRGRGRDDFPVPVLWRTLLTSIGLRHHTMEACLAELRRNEKLRRVVGIEEGGPVPSAWNMSRFLRVLGKPRHYKLLRKVFHDQVAELGRVVLNLARHTAGDSTHLSARREGDPPQEKKGKGKKKGRRGERDESDLSETSLPGPAGGKKEYTDDAGKVTHVLEWWGYKVHLLVDRKHEVALDYRITSANHGDNFEVAPLVDEVQPILPQKRMETLAYDKAADDIKVHEALSDRGIKPVIEIRANPNGPKETVILQRGKPTQFVHDEDGTVHCYDTVSNPPRKQPMAFWGHDAKRGSLKYRCPAKAADLPCPSMEKCNGESEFGRTIRIDSSKDLRRFPAVPRGTKTFERLYKERTSVERVAARLKILWGLDDGNVAGRARFHAHVGAVMVVHLGLARLLAATPRWEGKTLGKLRLSPIASALTKTG